ncbi:hypothetical protein [Synechococcus sp. C9]|uniref:hypothetical protein n=1 Tax=Synechococcus sp. C9 TaxID=102119 RepID=UPI001FF1293D|nr:hypothetical protein [Synechococcus sp. C9]
MGGVRVCWEYKNWLKIGSGEWSLAQAAAVADHANLRMVSQTYGHLVSKVRMPDYES